jgi:hypothetical protein
MEAIGLVGAIASVASLAYALYARRELAKLKEYQIANLRNTLKHALVTMSNSYQLMNYPQKYDLSNNAATLERISATHISSTSIIRSIFSELSRLDLPYDDEKLNGYVKAGLITSNWVWEQALMYAKNPNSFNKPDLPEDTPTSFTFDQ